MDSPTDSICFISYSQDDEGKHLTSPIHETVEFRKEGLNSGGKSTKKKKTKKHKKQLPQNSLKKEVNLSPEGEGLPLPYCQPNSERVSSSSSDRSPLSPQLSYLINREKKDRCRKFGFVALIALGIFLIVGSCIGGSIVLVKHVQDGQATNVSQDKPENEKYIDQIVEGNVLLLIGGVATVIKTEFDQSSDGFSTGPTRFDIEQHIYTDIEVMGISNLSCNGIPEIFPLALKVSEASWDKDDESKYTNAFYDNGSIILCKAMKCYKSSKKDWTEIPVDSSIIPVSQAATASLGDKHFIIGGSPANNPKTSTNDIFMLDSETDKFTYLKYSQYGLQTGACAIGVESESAILITGGSSTGNKYSAFALFFGNKQWQQQLIPSLNTPRKLHGCARFKLFGRDVIVIVGGELVDEDDEIDKRNGGILASVEYLDVKNFKGGWKSLEPLNIGRTNHPSVGMVGKRLAVAGGSTKVDIAKMKPTVKSRINFPHAKARRAYPKGTLLQDESLDSVEYYDEEERKWILNEHGLQRPRHDHVTLLVPASLCFQ